MRIVRAVLLSFFAFGGAEAAEATEGRLIDKKSGSPIANAEILVLGTNGSVKTDANGHFVLTPDPAPPFDVVVVLPGGQIAKPVRIERSATGVVNIVLEAIVDVGVTVIGVAPSIDTSPGTGKTLLTASEIASRNPANLLQALENVPGVNQVSEGQAAVPAVRGLAQGRTLLLIDGGRVTAERRVGPSATFLDPSAIGSIDIARGPSSVAYGSDAFGGVISVVTKRAAANTPFSMTFSGTAGAGIPDRRGAVEIASGFKGGSIFAQAHVRETEDYDGPNGAILNSGWRDSGFLVKAERLAGNGMWSAGFQSDMARDIERPRNNSDVTRFFYPSENSHRFTAGYETSGVSGFSRLRVTGFLGASDQRTDQDTFATATRARSLVRADVAAKDFGLRAIGEGRGARGTWEVGVDMNGRFGLEAHDITVTYNLAGAETAVSDTLSTDSAQKIDTGVFGQFTGVISSSFTMSAGIRGDVVKNKNTGGYFGNRAETNSSASGFVSATARPFDGMSITGQVSRGSRDPRLSDMYYRGPTGRGFITANPDLETETSLQFDVNAQYSYGPLRAAAYGYRYEIKNLIERYQTTTDFFFFRNRGKARVHGVEVEAQAAIGRGFSIEFGAQLTKGEAVDDNAALDDMSPGSLNLVLRQAIGSRGQIFARAASYGEVDRPGPNETTAPAYTLVDAGASFRFSRHLELRASARNLFNESYHASPVARWVFGPGRSASMTLVAGF